MINPYFNKATQGTEAMKNIIHKQTAELIQQWGRDFFYIERKRSNLDDLFGEDYAGTFDGHHKLEMMPQGGTKYGDTDMMSNFGIVVKDEAYFNVAAKRFQTVTSLKYPYEGDLIYDPQTNRLFEIKHVENEDIFYTLEELPQYVLKCELFEYSHEKMNSGIQKVDAIDGVDSFTDPETGESEYEELTQIDNDSINDALLELANDDTVDDWDIQAVDSEKINNWDEENPFA